MTPERAKFVLNKQRESSPLPNGRVSSDPLDFHKSVPGYKPGTLRELPTAAKELGIGELWVKEESDRFGLPAYKALGTFWAVYKALNARPDLLRGEPASFEELSVSLLSPSELTLLAATDGNHGRAVAHVAKLLGMRARIFVPDNMVEERRAAITSEGAALEVIDGTYDDAVNLAATHQSASKLLIQDTAWDGYEAVPGWIAEGYSSIFLEAELRLQELGRKQPNLVLIQIGVGSLAAAAAKFYTGRYADEPVGLVGVEPLGADCMLESARAGRLTSVPGPHTSMMAGLNCGTPSSTAWPVISATYAGFVAIPDERAFEAMRLLATAGVVAGESGAAGLGGLMALSSTPQWRTDLGLSESTRALVVITEGATDEQAYSKIVNG